MIKPPSNVKTHEAFFSGDPAIVSLPPEASDEQRKELADRIDRARETGQWTDVLLANETPTTFVFKPLPSSVTGDLISMLHEGTERRFTVLELAFRLAIVDVKNLPDAGKIEFVNHPHFGRLASTAFLDRAGCSGELGASIIVELGSYVLSRARAANPKS